MTVSPSSPRHLILGGCGFIGRAVAAELARKGIPATLADRTPPAGLLPETTYVPFDMADADWDALLDGVGVVHHYAWSSIPATADADAAADLVGNVVPTLALLEAIKRRGSAAPRLVFASSGGTVYGRLRQIPVPEDHPLTPITAYGAGKAAAELYLGQYRAMYGLDCRVARVANPFGAGQNVARGQGAVSAFLHKALHREPIEIWGDGEVTRDYIHISDAAAGLVSLALCELDGSHFTFNIGSGRGASLNSIVSEIREQFDHPLTVRYKPARPFDVPISILDVSLAQKLFGWRPHFSLAQGIACTIDELTSHTGPVDDVTASVR